MYLGHIPDILPQDQVYPGYGPQKGDSELNQPRNLLKTSYSLYHLFQDGNKFAVYSVNGCKIFVEHPIVRVLRAHAHTLAATCTCMQTRAS